MCDGVTSIEGHDDDELLEKENERSKATIWRFETKLYNVEYSDKPTNDRQPGIADITTTGRQDCEWTKCYESYWFINKCTIQKLAFGQ